MRYLVGFLIPCVVGLVVLSVGCGQDCSLVGCGDAVTVALVPGIDATYDVTLVLDGEAEAFTCTTAGTSWVSVENCTGQGFLLRGAPESVEITVNAEDGSWNGSLSTSPTYRSYQPNGPGCTPTCRSASLTIANDVGAFEVQP
jgi:hypothetical protein